MNIAATDLVSLPASSVSTTVKLYVERQRLYTIITAIPIANATVKVRYLDGAGIVKLDQTLANANPLVYAVGCDVAGTLEVIYQYASDPAARTVPLVIAKEITV